MAGDDALLIRDPRPPELGEKSVKLVSICQSSVKGVNFHKGETNKSWKKQCQAGDHWKGSVRQPPYFDSWWANWQVDKKEKHKLFNVRDFLRHGQSIYNAHHHAEAFHEARRAAEGEEINIFINSKGLIDYDKVEKPSRGPKRSGGVGPRDERWQVRR
jgi:hypothetical protein